MKIEIEIPKEYEYDYNTDKFAEFFRRVLGDISDGVLCGRYERETANMLMEALKTVISQIRSGQIGKNSLLMISKMQKDMSKALMNLKLIFTTAHGMHITIMVMHRIR